MFALDIKKQHVYTLYIALNNNPDINWQQVWNEFDHTNPNRANQGDLFDLCESIRDKLDQMNTSEDFNSMITMTLKAYMRVQSDLERRKVGKCLNFSKPGQGADLLLGAS